MPDIQILDLTRKPKYRVTLPGGTAHDLGVFDVAAFQMFVKIEAAQKAGLLGLDELAAQCVALAELVHYLLPTSELDEIIRLDLPELWRIVNQASATALAAAEALKNGVAPAATARPPALAAIPHSKRRTSAATSSPG